MVGNPEDRFSQNEVHISLRKVLRYQKNCVYLAEVQQDVFYEPSVQSKYC